MVFICTPVIDHFFRFPAKKNKFIAVTGGRIIFPAMDTRVNKNAHAEHHRKEIISLLKRAYFFNPVDYGGFYPSGGHPASSTLFTEPPEAETGPFLRLFFPAGDEVIKKVSREGKKLVDPGHPYPGSPTGDPSIQSRGERMSSPSQHRTTGEMGREIHAEGGGRTKKQYHAVVV